MKTLAAFNKPIDAHLLVARLVGNGVPAFTRDEHMVTLDWLASNAIGGVKVDVADEDYARALEIMAAPPGRDGPPPGPRRVDEARPWEDPASPSRLAELLRRPHAAVFFHAPWSEESFRALRVLRERIQARGLAADAVAILDTDAEVDALPFLIDRGQRFSGAGDAAILRAGKIELFAALAADTGGSIAARVDAFLDQVQAR